MLLLITLADNTVFLLSSIDGWQEVTQQLPNTDTKNMPAAVIAWRIAQPNTIGARTRRLT